MADRPIADGEVVVKCGSIAAVRPAPRRAGGSVRDLGDCALLPGLVNAHTHLEYTVLRSALDGQGLFEWVRALVALKARVPARVWPASALLGAAEAAASGTTCVGDCTDSGAGLSGAVAVGLRGVVYQEAFGVDDAAARGCVEALDGKVRALQASAAGSRLRVGISPHAPYTVQPQLMRALAAYAAGQGLPVCIHAAESQAEVEWLRTGGGPFGRMYAQRGIAWTPPGCGVSAYLEELGALGPRTLLAHGVQASADDAARAARAGSAWVHCPRSNARLGCGLAPLALLAADGGKVGLGTDSAASGGTLDMLEEMRFAALMQRAAHRQPDALLAADVLRLATLGGARALGLDSRVGTLEAGKDADLCAVSLRGLAAGDPVAALVFGASGARVRLTMVAGEPVYEAGRWPGAQPAAARRVVARAARRLGVSEA